jgi:23S rRNA (cytosine1962-C5)-methyltransferase
MQMTENSASKNDYQASLFLNRLSKRYRTLRKWARKDRVTCYRLYDRDIPEIPLAADLYELLPPDISTKIEAAHFFHQEAEQIAANIPGIAADIASRQYLHLFLYERPYEKPDDEEQEWLETMTKAAATALGIEESHVITKIRKRQRGDNQYEKQKDTQSVTGIIQEQGQLFHINLSDYIDTGLFFDHRPLRNTIRNHCAGKSVLNLFCYTGSFSVYAAEGHASRVESVDLSNTYLTWAENNFRLNEFTDTAKYIFTRSDVNTFLDNKQAGSSDPANRYDIIILDPPTFSNSKSTQIPFDINRDWSSIVTKCLNLLNDNGILYFSTNSRRLSFDRSLLPQATEHKTVISVTDCTEESLPEDYKETKAHRLWMFKTGKAEQ